MNLDWLRRVLGITYTTQLYLYEPIDDVEWKHLANLHELNRLDIHEATVTPQNLQHICNLRSLKSLGFGNSSFLDSALGQLQHCDSLRELGFHLCRIDSLGQLPQSLEYLSFLDCPIDDSHIPDIKFVPRLLLLELTGTKVSNEGVGELAEQKKIHDDKEDFRWLSKLVLRTETITDESVLLLSSMKGLSEVVLEDSGFTALGVSRLQEMRPNLVIHYH